MSREDRFAFGRRAAFVASCFALAWPIVGYPTALWVLRRRPRLTRPPTPLPTVTVIVPTYNEASRIVGRLENLAACRYPDEALDIIVVDSGSDDGTAERAVEYAATHLTPGVSVLRESERRGKAAAINLALRAATGEVVVLTDAPTSFEPDAVIQVMSAFGDPAVGAATGYFDVTGEGDALQREEQQFWRIRNTLRTLEASLDATPFLQGELCAVRRGLVAQLDEDSLADDMNVALQVRRGGHRVVVVPGARFSERRTASLAELLETKSRRAAGGIQELVRFRPMMFRPRFGWFGMLILPSALLYYIPVRVPALVVVAGGLARALGASRPRVGTACAAAIVLAPIVVRHSAGARMALFNEWIFVQGWRRVLRRRMDVRWKQERSTRQPAQ